VSLTTGRRGDSSGTCMATSASPGAYVRPAAVVNPNRPHLTPTRKRANARPDHVPLRALPGRADRPREPAHETGQLAHQSELRLRAPRHAERRRLRRRVVRPGDHRHARRLPCGDAGVEHPEPPAARPSHAHAVRAGAHPGRDAGHPRARAQLPPVRRRSPRLRAQRRRRRLRRDPAEGDRAPLRRRVRHDRGHDRLRARLRARPRRPAPPDGGGPRPARRPGRRDGGRASRSFGSSASRASTPARA
jgi:hypothetical protein